VVPPYVPKRDTLLSFFGGNKIKLVSFGLAKHKHTPPSSHYSTMSVGCMALDYVNHAMWVPHTF
jgi:hypothetical protein